MSAHLKYESATMNRIRKHQFAALLFGAIAISLFLVFVALSLYQSSGTIQLDLSRPGYAELREESRREDGVYRGFSSEGPINEETLKEFEKLYREKAEQANKVDTFAGNALSDEALNLTPEQ